MTPISLHAAVQEELTDLSKGAKERAMVAGRRAQDFLKEAFTDFIIVSPDPKAWKLRANALENLDKAQAEIARARKQLDAWEEYDTLYEAHVTKP